MTTTIHPFSPEEIMAHLDGELTAHRSSEAAQHLAECRECQALAASLRSVTSSLAQWEVESSLRSAPVHVLHEPRPMSLPFWRQKWLMAASAAVLLLGISIAVKRSRLENFRPNGVSEVVATESIIGGSAESNSAYKPKTSQPAGDRSVLERFSNLQRGQPAEAPSSAAPAALPPAAEPQRPAVPAPTSKPLIARTAELAIVSQDFDHVRAEVQRITAAHGGYIGGMQLNMQKGTSRSLTASLQIPSTQLDNAIGDLKQLGKVSSESQGGQDVTQRSVDLDARLQNLKRTEARLQQILQNRTGRLSEVLEVEQAVDQTRGEIETAEAEHKLLANQVSYASLQFNVTETYEASVSGNDEGSILVRLHNAGVAGLQNAVNMLISIAAFALSAGPALLLAVAVSAYPVMLLWRRFRRLRSVNVL